MVLGFQKIHRKYFKRFYRVDSTGSRAHGGTGQLSIVGIDELHSGQIDLKVIWIKVAISIILLV